MSTLVKIKASNFIGGIMLLQTNLSTTMVVENPTDLYKLKLLSEVMKLNINKTKIARDLGIDRRTVTKYFNGYKKPKHRKKAYYLDEYHDIIMDLLSDENCQIFHYKINLYRYLTDNKGLDCPESTFRNYILKHPEIDDYFKLGKSPYITKYAHPMRFETPPGQQAQLDWKESIKFTLKDGEIIEVNVLVLLMGYSRFRVYKLSTSKSQDVLMSLLTECFETLGGVPKEIVTDNMKTVMDIPRTRSKKGKINLKFEAFAKDMGFKICPCIAATPQTKGKVESQMKILDEIYAYNGTLDYIELNRKIEEINERVNMSYNQGNGKIPCIAFEKEKSSLLPLVSHEVRNQYKIKTVTVKVNTASMVTYKKNQYSVPPEYIGQHVQYQVYDNNLYIYFNTKLIQVHAISDKKLNMSEQDYIALTSRTFKKDKSVVENIAKANLKYIGEIFDD